MTDPRSEDQKVAAVRASMTMAGYAMTPRDEEDVRLIFRGDITGDKAALETIEAHGYGDSARATLLRQRIAEANNPAR